jgi:hypothetical protein
VLLIFTTVLLAASPASITLPGGPPVVMDYLAFDAKLGRLWVPAGNTGKTFVLDVKTRALTPVAGFETSVMKGHDGKDRTVGPSSATVGEGYVYVGNRANSSVCAVDAKTLEKKGCVTLPSSPDGVAFVATTHEVWVTTPRADSITILDVKKPDAPTLAGTVKLEGPEGYAVDPTRGLFYSNQEDLDRTAVFDVKTRALVATWNPGCGKEGPRGLALDVTRRHLFVACATGTVKTLDAAKEGAVLGEVQAGDGVDNIDYLPSSHRLYAAGGRAATLTVAEVSASGAIGKPSSTPTAEGARVVVVDTAGTAWVADSKGGRVILVTP